MSKNNLETWALTRKTKDYWLKSDPNTYSEYYASDFVHVLLSSLAYKKNVEGDNAKFVAKPGRVGCRSKYNVYLDGWKVAKVFSPADSDDYYSCLYLNPHDGQAVLAHRGTSIPRVNKSFRADIKEVLKREIGQQQIAAYLATKESLEIIDDLNKKSGEEYANYHFSITGHSLGAWLGELSLYFCHRDFNYNIAKAVVFDSPGMGDLFNNFKLRSTSGNHIDYSKSLNLVTYLSAPNLVNSCNQHKIGKVYRVYPKIDEVLKSSVIDKIVEESKNSWIGSKLDPSGEISKTISKHACLLNGLRGHELNIFLDVFDPNTGMPMKYDKVESWPLIVLDVSRIDWGKYICNVLKFGSEQLPFLKQFNAVLDNYQKLFLDFDAIQLLLKPVVMALSEDTDFSSITISFEKFDVE